MLVEQLNKDLKEAMLARDAFKVEVLRGLKSAILYASIELNKRDVGLSDEEIITVFRKETKKRREAADLYRQAKSFDKAEKEAAEIEFINVYLPKQMSEDQLKQMLVDVMTELRIPEPQKQDMGKLIGAIKAKVGSSADGALVAKVVNEKIK